MGGAISRFTGPGSPQAGECGVHGWSWVLPGQLAGMARPGLYRSLEEDLADLARQGVGLVVTLTEDPLPERALEAQGLRGLHLPVPDFAPPGQRQLDTYLARARRALEAGQAVGVHCAAGVGRTGTVLAVHLVSTGQDPQAAIHRIRALRPGSLEVRVQEQAVHAWYARHR